MEENDIIRIDTEDETKKSTPTSKAKEESEADNTLIDVHIRNPLKRITELLEEIKSQKAFSFTFKGSLGIMGVVLVFSMVGLFGTTHALCDKGVQSQIGILMALEARDYEEVTIITRLNRINEQFQAFINGNKVEERNEKRTVLVTEDLKTIHITRGRDVSLVPFRSESVIVTGPYNECSRDLKVENQEQIETV